MTIYSVEEIIDLGTRVISVFFDKTLAQELYDKLESERIASHREHCAKTGKPFYDWMLYPKHELNEYEVIERTSGV